MGKVGELQGRGMKGGSVRFPGVPAHQLDLQRSDGVRVSRPRLQEGEEVRCACEGVRVGPGPVGAGQRVHPAHVSEHLCHTCHTRCECKQRATPEALRWAEVAAVQGEQPTGRVWFCFVFHTLG